MRIISNFQDYYDLSQAQGYDSSLTFLRKNEKFKLKEDSSIFRLNAFLHFIRDVQPNRVTLSGKFSSKVVEVVVDFGVILFVGRLYPFARVNTRARGNFTFDTNYFYSIESLNLFKQSLGLGPGNLRVRSWQYPERSTKAFFSLQDSAQFLDFSYQQQMPIALIFNGFLELNPRLSELEFFKEVDTWSAYQELSMFLGNSASPEVVPLPISDAVRIQQHGFDKWSFRRMPN